MKRLALCVIAAMALTGCRKSSAPVLQQGEYEFDGRSFDADTATSDRGGRQIGPTTFKLWRCIDDKEAADLRLLFSLEQKECNFPRFTMSDGKIDLQVVCRYPNETATTTASGTYTRTSLSMAGTLKNSGTSTDPASESKMEYVAKRTGPCTEESRRDLMRVRASKP